MRGLERVRRFLLDILAIRRQPLPDSADHAPWMHPYLTAANLGCFRAYSEQVWQFASEYFASHPQPMRIGCINNLAQTMYKWAGLAQERGHSAELFLNPMDGSALSRPEWEEFDGEHSDVLDGYGFLLHNPGIHPRVPVRATNLEGIEFQEMIEEFKLGRRHRLLRLLSRTPDVRFEAFLRYSGVLPYFEMVRQFADLDVLMAASTPTFAYLSGMPYCAFCVGGDLQLDAGRGSDYGELMVLSINSARFVLISNPHMLGHCRRLGVTNAVYLPYVMDDRRYTRGEGQSRSDWEARMGSGVFVLMTSRIDKDIKGQGTEFLHVLGTAMSRCPQLRFICLDWGHHVEDLRAGFEAVGLGGRVAILPPVGKTRLIDYYRSCDLVLDQLVWGYHGATALEAAAIGKPVIMKLRKEHLEPWYRNDSMPACVVATAEDLGAALQRLANDQAERRRAGEAMRNWLVRNHGEDRCMPILLALLRLAADRVPLPCDLVSPLVEPTTDAEVQYHRSCLSSNLQRLPR